MILFLSRVSAASIGVDEDEDDDDLNDDGDDSFGEDGDDEMMDGGSELTTQLAAAGWQHGVVFCFVFTFHFISREVPSFLLLFIIIYNNFPSPPHAHGAPPI